MEKMNQVSVTEFMSKSKEEMYDNAVAMVEKYNRLVDICNDSCERIADLVIERDNLSKGVQKLIAERDELNKTIKAKDEEIKKRYTDVISQSKTICNLKKELDGTKEALDNTIKNWVPLVAHEVVVNDLKKEIKKLNDEVNHWKDQERIRTDQLRATERKVEELWEEIHRLNKGEDDHGRKGFKEYIEWLVKEEETKFKESWKARLNEELSEIFKEEETAKDIAKKELNEAFGVPCGSDAIE